MTELDYYRLIRSRIEHEDQLMGSRLSYFVASQSFLLLSYAMTVNGPARTPVDDWYAAQARFLLVLIPLLSIATCLVIYASIFGAILGQRQLRAMACSRISAKAWQALPPIQSEPPVRLLGHGVPVLVPLIFLVVWAFLLFAGAGYPPPKHVAPPPGAQLLPHGFFGQGEERMKGPQIAAAGTIARIVPAAVLGG